MQEGWYPDPTVPWEYLYWNGKTWLGKDGLNVSPYHPVWEASGTKAELQYTIPDAVAVTDLSGQEKQLKQSFHMKFYTVGALFLAAAIWFLPEVSTALAWTSFGVGMCIIIVGFAFGVRYHNAVREQQKLNGVFPEKKTARGES